VLLYFIRAGDYLKIGVTTDLDRRLLALRTASPLPLVVKAVRPGTVREERAWHQRFAHLRVQGEWFRWTPELAAAIRDTTPRGQLALPFAA
jgi:hypothetical protein